MRECPLSKPCNKGSDPTCCLPAGGLPDGWLSNNKVFRKLEYLDLSNNKLGTSNGVTQYPVTWGGSSLYSDTDNAGSDIDITAPNGKGWCLNGADGGVAGSFGWCPRINSTGVVATPLSGALANLRFLDISNNELKGELAQAAKATSFLGA